MKAATIKHVMQYFDPIASLKGAELEAWFMDRKPDLRKQIKFLLELEAEPQKILLIGHRGSGKSTELNKLAEELTANFHVINIDVKIITGRTDLQYEDLMLALSTQVTQYCIDNGLLNAPMLDQVRKGLEVVRDWWMRVVAGAKFDRPALEADLGVQFSALLADIQIGVRQSAFTREAFIDQISRLMPDLIKHLNWVIEQAQRGGKRLLIVVEGTDKLDLASAHSIFRDHAATIIAPEASMIYTFPVALRHTYDYENIKSNFAPSFFLPNLSVYDAYGQPNLGHKQKSLQLVLARMDEHLIAQDALELVISAYGGIPNRLVYLMRSAALYALTRDERAPNIVADDVSAAIKDLRSEMRAPLTREDIRVLSLRHRDRRLTNDLEEQRLLYQGSLIDYSNGETWCDVHPVLLPLLEQVESINASNLDDTVVPAGES